MKNSQVYVVWQQLLKGMALRYGTLYLLAMVSSVLEVASIGLVFPLLSLVMSGHDTVGLPPFAEDVLQSIGINASIERLALFLIAVFVVKNFLKFIVEYENAKTTNHIRGMWMKRLMQKYLQASFRLFVETKQGAMVHNLFNLTVEALAGLKQFVALFMYGFSSFVVLVGMVLISWQITLASIAVLLLVYAVVNRPLLMRSVQLGKARINAYQQVNELPTEAFRGIREIKAYGAGGRVAATYNHLVDRMVDLRVSINFYQLLPGMFPEIALITVLGLALIVLSRQAAVDLPGLLPFIGTYVYAAYRLFTNGSVVMRNLIEIKTYWPSLVMLADLFAKDTYPEVSQGKISVIPDGSSIELRHVLFSHLAGKPTINGVDVKFPQGQISAVVGDSGAGKSTLADLLIRMTEPNQGAIEYANRNIAEFNLEAWRARVGFIGQDTFLFHGTIRENIAFGLSQASDAQVAAAAGAAEAHDFIQQTEHGYQTIVGERGAKLSGGQRQRIAIARALIRKPRILILDEATSALDLQSEAAVINTIEGLAKTMIVILITHRLSAIPPTAHIFVLKRGRIVESGTHHTLLQDKGEYWRLWGTAAH